LLPCWCGGKSEPRPWDGRERHVGAIVPVAHFSVERMVQKTEALYEELIGEKMERGGGKVERGRMEGGRWKRENGGGI